ncbi:biotin--[acetyl-CoA-carboxylase] ligase [Herbiconiux daphne]|uniref:biotin--[biotin carboxyl-carrier protein] ligase n=1 Tax=Herbiconiux daphne TaxID=2970914 RepID=A0ABT2H4J0_9MICO|nr:biotin--[acetyl-CoA-carboxylase] ligase [Herbiconiux daphne]MCS5734860.1 biotin--[acetyl-CoA-carboxylase] ligase [Herbiconiux daphne]
MAHRSFPLSEATVPKLVWRPQAGSTNVELVEAATGADAADWPDLSVLATDDQVAGRGRLGRTWTAPAGRSLAISVLLRPRRVSGEAVPLNRYGMLPLLAGVAMSQVVGRLVGSAHISNQQHAAEKVSLKWPNDVLIGDRKVCGILAELLPEGQGVVIGAGINLTLTADELPTPVATSLALAGVHAVSADAVLAGYLRDLSVLYRHWLAADGDAVASGVLEAAVRMSGTLGRRVRVELPGGEVKTGVARSIDETGRLVVEVDGAADPLVVAAGDVTHLRHDDS